jgi:hypothetical protein
MAGREIGGVGWDGSRASMLLSDNVSCFLAGLYSLISYSDTGSPAVSQGGAIAHGQEKCPQRPVLLVMLLGFADLNSGSSRSVLKSLFSGLLLQAYLSAPQLEQEQMQSADLMCRKSHRIYSWSQRTKVAFQREATMEAQHKKTMSMVFKFTPTL